MVRIQSINSSIVVLIVLFGICEHPCFCIPRMNSVSTDVQIDSLTQYVVKDSSILKNLSGLLMKTTHSLFQDKYPVLLYYDKDGYYARSILSKESTSRLRWYSYYKDSYGWMQYNGTTFILAGHPIPWTYKTEEKIYYYDLLCISDNPLISIGCDFHIDGENLILDEYRNSLYDRYLEDAFYIEQEGRKRVVCDDAYQNDEHYRLSFKLYEWRDSSVLRQIEDLTGITNYSFCSGKEKHLYSMRMFQDKTNKAICLLFDSGIYPLTDGDYALIREMSDIVGVIIRQEYTILLQGDDINSFIVNTENYYDESFRTIAFDEAIDLYLKQSCDKFIFVIENGKVLIGLIDAEC